MKELRSEYFEYLQTYLNIMDIEPLITQVATRQLPRQVPAYIEEKLGKMLPTSVLYGTQILFFNPMIYWLEHLSFVQNSVKHIHFQDHIQGNQCPLAIMYNLLVFLLSCRFE